MARYPGHAGRGGIWHTFDMPVPTADNKVESTDLNSGPEQSHGDDNPAAQEADAAPREIGGRGGPDPVRYGDWEKAGRCIDF